jgi:hypothetical protein
MTPDEQQNPIEKHEKAIRVEIDDYKDTIFAILGFCSLWFFDRGRRTNRPYTIVFQGRHLVPSYQISSGELTSEPREICPDLGVVVNGNKGILGEVKKNFPPRANDDRARRIVDQLKSYDQNLTGWPTNDGKLASHEIVLLVHQTTSKRAQEYFAENLNAGRLGFTRPFAILQFNRSDQRVPYFFFQTVQGVASHPLDIDLSEGIQVPMEALVNLYSESKLYDAEPPLAYTLHLMWEQVIVRIASENPHFERLHRNQKIEVAVEIDQIVKILHEGFSFWRRWYKDTAENQPHLPKREWVERACQFMVDTGEARWSFERNALIVLYSKHEDILGHFVRLQAESEAKSELQPELPGISGNMPKAIPPPPNAKSSANL